MSFIKLLFTCPRTMPFGTIHNRNCGNLFLLRRNLISEQGSGGAGRDRTDDILLAKQALSQLSYSPEPMLSRYNKVVGLVRFELTTSRLSSARSNQLSYKPARATIKQTRSIAALFPEKGCVDGDRLSISPFLRTVGLISEVSIAKFKSEAMKASFHRGLQHLNP
jgi:hypothetical protein